MSDYRRDLSITHHYDLPVHGEGLESILAVPVVVSGISRAVIYAAARERGAIGDRIADIVVQASRRLSREITVRDEVDIRVRLLQAHSIGAVPVAGTEELRDINAELRSLAQSSSDPRVRIALQALSGRMARALGPSTRQSSDIGLSARELDVLAQVALGCTNIEAAERLSLKPETIKSYLRSAMRKTATRTRLEAVVVARKHRLLP